MHKILMAAAALLSLGTLQSQVPDFMTYPAYTGSDLGVHWSAAETKCRLWAPTAEAVRMHLYANGQDGLPSVTVELAKGERGTWYTTLAGNRHGTYYTCQVKVNGKWLAEVPDPYAKAAGVNGRRGMIVNMAAAEPQGWQQDVIPKAVPPTDAVVYELHVRDASIHPSSGAAQKGGYLGLAEAGTKTPDGTPTGIDHLKALGITHVHLLPVFDFNSVDESKPNMSQYNWGYDPLNYNVPEGSYSSDATRGEVRIREFRQMVMALHKAGIGVVMDVVYNHTASTENSVFNQTVPGYYYRQKADGSWSDASACGNETASERPMMRKFMIESLLHWVKEYHIDGFRFDLMGIHDIETMNTISAALNEAKPGILLYGEGWTAGESPLAEVKRALKKHVSKLNGIAVFGDDLRDGIKGSVFKHEEKGFATGNAAAAESVKFGLSGASGHGSVDMYQVNYSIEPYAASPAQVVSYAECHDNHVLWDRIALSNPDATVAQRREMHRLALGIVLTAQGVGFLHAGTEFFRTKQGVENSFQSPDSINAINWNMASEHRDMVTYVHQLIAMRKAHPSFRLGTAGLIGELMKFKSGLPKGVIGYTVSAEYLGDTWKQVTVLYNGNTEPVTAKLDTGGWKTAIHNNRFRGGRAGKKVNLAASSMTILYSN
jgi:pullulanase